MSETTCFTVVFEGDVRAIEDNPFGIESPFGKPQQVMLGDVQDLIAEETEWADRTKRELDLVYEAIPLPFSLEPPDGGAVSASEAVKKMVAIIARLEADNKRLWNALDDVLWMAEEWYEHGGKDTTMNEDDAYGKALENARAAFIALTQEKTDDA